MSNALRNSFFLGKQQHKANNRAEGLDIADPYNMVVAARGIAVPVPPRAYSLIERDSS